MHKTKIDWADYVWNPVTGCEHQCPYCYARKMANRLKGRYGLLNTDWVIIGAETGNRKGKIKLQNEWVSDAMDLLEKLKIPVFIKNNAGGIRQEYPTVR